MNYYDRKMNEACIISVFMIAVLIHLSLHSTH